MAARPRVPYQTQRGNDMFEQYVRGVVQFISVILKQAVSYVTDTPFSQDVLMTIAVVLLVLINGYVAYKLLSAVSKLFVSGIAASKSVQGALSVALIITLSIGAYQYQVLSYENASLKSELITREVSYLILEEEHKSLEVKYQKEYNENHKYGIMADSLKERSKEVYRGGMDFFRNLFE